MFQLNSLNPTRISSQNVSSTKSKTYDLDNDIKIQCFNKDQILFVSFFSSLWPTIKQLLYFYQEYSDLKSNSPHFTFQAISHLFHKYTGTVYLPDYQEANNTKHS